MALLQTAFECCSDLKGQNIPNCLSMENSNLIFLFGPLWLLSLPTSLRIFGCECVRVRVCVCGNKPCHDSISPLYGNHPKVEGDVKVGMSTF